MHLHMLFHLLLELGPMGKKPSRDHEAFHVATTLMYMSSSNGILQLCMLNIIASSHPTKRLCVNEADTSVPSPLHRRFDPVFGHCSMSF